MGAFDFKIPDVFAIDHGAIDTEHHEIVEALRAYLKDIDAKSPSDFVSFLEDIGGRIVTHFRNEEQVMEAAGYPQLRSHQVQHRQCLERLREVIVESRSHHATHPAKSLTELFKILVADVVEADQGFARYLEKQA